MFWTTPEPVSELRPSLRATLPFTSPGGSPDTSAQPHGKRSWYRTGGGALGKAGGQTGRVRTKGLFSGVGSHEGSHSVNKSETWGPGHQEELKPDPPPRGQALGTRERPKEPLRLTTWPRVLHFTKKASETCLPGTQTQGQGLQGWKGKRVASHAGREKPGPYHPCH